MLPDQLLKARQAIGQVLKASREKKNIPIKRLSKICGLTRTTIYALENGKECYYIDSMIIYKNALRKLKSKKKNAKDY